MSDPNATLSHYHPLKKDTKMEKEICTLEIVIDGTPYYYEAHSYQRIAEILHGQIETLNFINDKHNSNKTIDTFTIHRFQ
jgi:hypothetical protein